jgi:hypothetical protein
MLAMKARDDDRQQTLSHKLQNETRAALPSPEAKRPFQRQRACVNRRFLTWFPSPAVGIDVNGYKKDRNRDRMFPLILKPEEILAIDWRLRDVALVGASTWTDFKTMWIGFLARTWRTERSRSQTSLPKSERARSPRTQGRLNYCG